MEVLEKAKPAAAVSTKTEPITTSSIKIQAVGHHPGKDRTSTGYFFMAKQFALSQHFNLYFVAFKDHVHVFNPGFPQQKISTEPLASIKYAATSSRRRGYMDTQNPHTANHIIVGDLGLEEILLIACDDGDVIAYRVRSIEAAIRENSLTGLQPFFLQNVGASAWGLAIHRNARMIAVSSNSHKILIFAFALIGHGKTSDFDFPPIQWNGRPFEAFGGSFVSSDTPRTLRSKGHSLQTEHVRRDRQHDIVFGLSSHLANVPNIAFWNGEQGHKKVFLVSTDIEGHVLIWSVWNQTVVSRIKVPLASGCAERGWSVLCLNPLNFQHCENIFDAYGCPRPRGIKPQANTRMLAWKNTRCKQIIADNSPNHPSVIKSANSSGNFNLVQSDTSPDFSAGNNEGGENGSDSDVDSDAYIEETVQDADPDIGLSSEVMDDDDDDAMSITDTTYSASENEPSDTTSNGTPIEGVDSSIQSTNSQDHINHAIPTDFSSTSYRPTLKRALSVLSNSSMVADDLDCGAFPRVIPKLAFDILSTTISEVALFSNITYNAGGPSVRESPRQHTRAVVCEGALSQIISPHLVNIDQIERMNMSHEIPELGLVLIGNQTGRVAILSMTRLRTSISEMGEPPQGLNATSSPNPQPKQKSRKKQSQTNKAQHKDKTPAHDDDCSFESERSSVEEHHAFRIEAIVPFASQEATDQRPEHPLLGMAVSPVQGPRSSNDSHMQNGFTSAPAGLGEINPIGSGSRRWRLMMMYYDHTILSYEISRSCKSGEFLII